MTTNKPKNTDQDLLELAAKAVGYSIWQWERDGSALISDPTIRWNPLEDDGDALRLAVKLDMIIDIDTGECATSVDYTTLLGDFVLCEGHRFDPYAATRRAIVRAAAEMGRDKPWPTQPNGQSSFFWRAAQ